MVRVCGACVAGLRHRRNLYRLVVGGRAAGAVPRAHGAENARPPVLEVQVVRLEEDPVVEQLVRDLLPPAQGLVFWSHVSVHHCEKRNE